MRRQPMSDRPKRRYMVTGDGITTYGDSLEEAITRFRDCQPAGQRVVEAVRIPVHAEPQRTFDGSRFFERLDVLQDVRQHQLG